MRKFYLLLAGVLLCGLAGAQELTFRSYPLPDEKIGNGKLFLDGNDVWVATGEGACKFSGGAWEVIQKSNGLPADSVKQISKDTQGNVWFLTKDAVGVRHPDQSWTYSYENRFDWGGMVQRVGDDLWLSANNAELKKIDPTGTTTTYGWDDGLRSTTEDIVRDAHGVYYILNYNYIVKSKNNTWEIDTSLWNSILYDIVVTRNNAIYITHERGVVFDANEDDYSWFGYLHSPYLDEIPVYAMAEGLDGTLYFGTRQGLVTCKNGFFRRYTTADGLTGNCVRDVQVDALGNVWCTVETLDANNYNGPLTLVEIPYSITTDPTYVHGIVYHDENGDGVQGESEAGVPNQFIHLMPRDAYAVTNEDGTFLFPSEAGENTMNWVQPDWWMSAGTPTSHTFTSPVDDGRIFDIGIMVKPIREVSAFASSGNARPGFELRYNLYISNRSNVAIQQRVTFEYDPSLEYLSSDLAPAQHDGNTLYWDVEVEKTYYKAVTLVFRVPANTPLGKVLHATVSVPTLPGETETRDNSYTLEQIVRGSFDPNDKLVGEGILEQRYVEMGTPLNYTIRFQNTGTDTAFTVRITDELDPKLNLTSLEIIRTSHPATYVLDSRTLTFHFENILLPDSTTDEPNSHGYIQYRIKPVSAMADGTQVRNKAAIYFDFNEPVVTNETVNTYVNELPSNSPTSTGEDLQAGVMTYPNPVRDGNLVIVSKNAEVMKGSVTLTSLAGSTMRAASLQGVRTLVDVKGVAPGMYVLKVENRGVKSTRKIVIVQE